MWSGPKGSSMEDRMQRAQDAKKALLERFRAAPKPGDPAYEEQQARLKAIADSRRDREALRAKQKAEDEAEEARKAAEKAARLAAEEAAIMAQLKAEEEEKLAQLKAEQKAAR